MSGDPPFDDEVWDEERWEAFLRDRDKLVDRYMELIFRFTQKYPQPDPDDVDAYAAWRSNLRAVLRDGGWRRDDMILPLFWFDEEHAEDQTEQDPDILGGTGMFREDDAFDDLLDDVARLPLYQRAFALSAEVFEWAHALSGDVKDSTLVHFCSHVSQIPANIARGHGIGYEREAMGGNIACAKRGLADANTALDLLRQMKRALHMEHATYRRLYEHLFDLRNDLGIYIQDLRDRFNLGID
ncbi:MAG: hypothetical protein ACE5G0_04375 [Rhodothermales bacterium]